ncbi:MAG: pectate lyase [Opitutaceae bacterium]|nr:pectate lyase [Opitutaceae bacterium]
MRLSLGIGLAAAGLLGPAGGAAAVSWADLLKQDPAWYAGPEARAVAASIRQYQTEPGGWPKNADLSRPPSAEFLARTEPDHRAPTIDNGGTTTPLRILARVAAAGDDASRASFLRGLEYLLAAQYESGGWPQYYPLRPGYYTHITYNDDAMVNVLRLLRDVAAGGEPYGFVDADRRRRSAAAVERGVACILRTQVVQDGRLTAWCAQHDETTFAPAWARRFEPPSLSGMESVGLVRFLMSLEQPSPAVVAAVEGAVAWFAAVPVRGLRLEDAPGADGRPDRRAVADPAAPPLWARFYELGTNRPLFVGRDQVFHYDFNAVERERRLGYAYLGTWPAALLAKEYPRWRARHSRP